MLDMTIAFMAGEHTAVLANADISLSAKPGTPLSTLLTEIGIASQTCLDDFLNDPTEEFKVSLNAMADQLADHVRGYLDFTRNTVVPVVSKLTENVTEAITKIPEKAFDGFDIIEDTLPRALEDSDFMTRVQSAHAMVQVKPNFIARCDQRSGEELVQLTSTGFTKWDDSFAEWFAVQPEGTLAKVWNSLWVDPVKAQDDVFKPEYIFSDPVLCIVAFLIASRLLSEDMQDSQLSLDDQRRYNAWVAFESSKALISHIDRYNSFVTTNTLVDTIHRNDRKIKVNASVYKQYLAEGGLVDVLMGLLVSEKSYRSISDITTHAKELVDDWSHYTLAAADYHEASFDGRIRELMVQEFDKLLEVSFGDLEAQKLAEVGVKENMSRIFKDAVYDVPRSQMSKDWQSALQRCTIEARYYYHSFVFEFFETMTALSCDDKLDSASAASMATQAIINNFIAEMMVKV